MIGTSLSANAHRGNERGKATRLMYDVKRKKRGRRVGSIDTIAVSVHKNDVSERAYRLERGGQWDSSPVGAWMATPDDVRYPHNLDPSLETDGRRFQNCNTRAMLFGSPDFLYQSGVDALVGRCNCNRYPRGAGVRTKATPLFACWADHTTSNSRAWGSAAAHSSFDQTEVARR
jgi:hypothetical protein